MTANDVEAVEAKLSEQRRFVLWWDGQGNRGGRPSKKPSQTGEGFDKPILHDLGLDYDTLHRWRRRLKAERDFEATVEAARG